MVEEQRSESEFKALQQELQQARGLDVRLDAAARSVADTETRLRRLARKKEGEDKLKAAQTRQQQSTAEIARLSEWRERYRSKESIAEQFNGFAVASRCCFRCPSGYRKGR